MFWQFSSLVADGKCRTCLTTGLRVGRTGNGRIEWHNTLLRVESICKFCPKEYFGAETLDLLCYQFPFSDVGSKDRARSFGISFMISQEVNKFLRYYVLLEALILLRSPSDLLMTSLIASSLHPSSERLRQRMRYGLELLKYIDESSKELGVPRAEIKKRLLFGAVPSKAYPVRCIMYFV